MHTPTAAIWLALLSSIALARSVINELSFGQHARLSQDDHSIPGWTITGADGFEPDILSDRVILTPPQPGSERGALWANTPNPHSEWIAELEFRASGPERGNGNLNLWYVKDKGLGTNAFESISSVTKFDGLAIVLDQHGGSGGSVTAYLSDGSISYRSHHNVHSLAFGRCIYPYRNLGRLSKLKFRQGADAFEVLVDDKPCFMSRRVKLPSGYFFGIHASSAENPDSFELYRFIVTQDSGRLTQTQEQPQQQQPLQGNPPQQPRHEQPQAVPQPGAAAAAGGQPASDPQIGQALAQLKQAMEFLTSHDQRINRRHDELLAKMQQVPHDQVAAVAQRLERIEKTVEQIRQDVEGKDYKKILDDLKHALDATQDELFGLPHSMSQLISSSAPRMGFFIFLILFFQGMLAVSYVIYKRRRSMSPKKLL